MPQPPRPSAFRRCAAWGLLLIALSATAPALAQRIFASGFEPFAPESDAEAARFLTQSTFGTRLTDIQRLRQIGYEAWLDEQFAAPASRQVPYLDYVVGLGEPLYQNARMEAWFRNAITGPDQLRQRVAYALSQILVVSDANGPLEIEPRAVSVYYDLLIDGAFGNYRALLGHITDHRIAGLDLPGMKKDD